MFDHLFQDQSGIKMKWLYVSLNIEGLTPTGNNDPGCWYET